MLLIDYIGLQGPEIEYAIYLLQRDRAGSSELKKFLDGKAQFPSRPIFEVSKSSADGSSFFRSKERTVFYSNPLYSAIFDFSLRLETMGKALKWSWNDSISLETKLPKFFNSWSKRVFVVAKAGDSSWVFRRLIWKKEPHTRLDITPIGV